MAHTYREIAYAILDETKTISDDTLLENEHLILIKIGYKLNTLVIICINFRNFACFLFSINKYLQNGR